MRHAKLFSIFVFVTLLGYGAAGFYSLPQATFQGDLTRMGLLPERLFGWTKQQPELDAEWMQQSSIQDADVLVIGDSFSASHVWQTALTRRGMKVHTEPWDSVRGICTDFTPWVRNHGFAGKYVVLESVERNLVDELNRSAACLHMQYHPHSSTSASRYSPPTISFDVNYGNYSGKLSTGIRTKLNVLRYQRLSSSPDFKTWLLPNDVKMARVLHGCELFSHARCNDTLFLAYDKPEELESSALENIEKLNTRLNGITPIWVVVPNKSTAYLYPDKRFWNEAERRFHAPNLLLMTQQAIQSRTVDLYPANNTHFSTTGYILMGEEIFKTMQLAKPQGSR